MNYQEMHDLLKINGDEIDVYMPNEVFTDLDDYITKTPQKAFAYSYLYLTKWLYRNCKYFNTDNLIDGNVIKEILGYDKSNRTMNYLTKKGGLLDEMEYTESTKDFPVSWDYKHGISDELSFLMSSDLDADTRNMIATVPKMFSLKRPVTGFQRVTKVTEDNEVVEHEELGTFYDVSNTNSVDFNVFMFCMTNKDLGVMGFYLYSFLKHKNDIFEGGFDRSLVLLESDTGISETPLIKYMGLLRSYKMIDCIHNMDYFAVGMVAEDRKANTYVTRNYESFSNLPVEYKRMEVMLRADYLEMKKLEMEELTGTRKWIEFDELLLPY